MMGHDAALAQYHYGITWDHMGVNGRSLETASRMIKY